MNETNLISSADVDRKYFTIIPRIVIAACEDPFELNLWVVIKEIAGEDGECYVSTPRLAELAHQSVATVYRKRLSLIEKGLILGVKVRDPQTKIEVWHLSLPDLWDANLAFSRDYPRIDDRINAQKHRKAGGYLSQREVLPITERDKEEPEEKPLPIVNHREIDFKQNGKAGGKLDKKVGISTIPRASNRSYAATLDARTLPPIPLAPSPTTDPIPIGISGEEYLNRLRSDHKHREYLLAEYHRLTQTED